MKFVNSGKSVEVTATADVVAGEGVVVGDTLGVAATNALNGEEYTLHLDGRFQLKAASGITFGQLDTLYWASDGSGLTASASGNTPCGKAALAKVAGTLVGEVILRG